MKKSILALSLGTFSLGIAEFTMMGILTMLSADLGVSVTKGGHFISAYASGVCAGAVLLPFFHRWPLKRLLLLLAAVIAIGNLGAAAAHGYGSLLIARFVSGLPHGAFFGVGAIVARKLADPGKEVSAVSLMIAGMTVATVLGVPVATFLTEHVSWRLVFFIVAIFGVLTLLSIRLWVPRLDPLPQRGGFSSQFAFLRTGAPWLIFGGVILGQIGLYCWYSYIDPLLTTVSGFSVSDLTWLMVVAGLGMFFGNLVAGRLADSYKPSAVAAAVMGFGILVLATVFFFAQVRWLMVPMLFLGTASLFGSGSPLQSSIVGYSRGGEMLGGTCIQIAYNAGNAIAAWLGGLVINATHSYREPSLTGMPILLAGCLLLIVLYVRYERGRKREPAS